MISTDIISIMFLSDRLVVFSQHAGSVYLNNSPKLGFYMIRLSLTIKKRHL